MRTVRNSSRLLGGWLLQGVPAPGGSAPGGCLLQGMPAPEEVSQHALRQTPREQNDRQV